MTFWKKSSRVLNKIPGWSYGLVIGIICLVIGYCGEQLTDIYQKAIMICLECIGIG